MGLQLIVLVVLGAVDQSASYMSATTAKLIAYQCEERVRLVA